MKRKIISINQDLCNGCGLCIPNCPEGAMKVIDGKVRLLSDLFCDGLGTCVGHCPEGALTVEEREAEVYDETKVMGNIIPQGEAVIRAHLDHLLDHGEVLNHKEAIEVLVKAGFDAKSFEAQKQEAAIHHHGCPGARTIDMTEIKRGAGNDTGTTKRESELRTWPVQLRLVSPNAQYFKGTDLLVSADCVAYALGDFHADYLSGKSLIIACPKLDDHAEEYIEKLTALIDHAKVSSITIMIMEVPCCSGLVHMLEEAMSRANRKIPYRAITVSLQGKVLDESVAGADR
jgi:ferredoxin